MITVQPPLTSTALAVTELSAAVAAVAGEQETAVGGLNVPYAVFEGLVAVGATVGNGLVIVAFHRERRLRRRTNYYIVSLAVADLLVGVVGIPCAVLSSVGLPRHLHLCVFSVSLIVVLCTVSILNLVAVSADRYWAILYPMAYSTNSNTKIAVSTYRPSNVTHPLWIGWPINRLYNICFTRLFSVVWLRDGGVPNFETPRCYDHTRLQHASVPNANELSDFFFSILTRVT